MSATIVLPKRMDILKTLATSPPIPDFVLPGLMAGTVGALIAPGATGKTLFLLQTCVALASGRPMFGGMFGSEAAAPAKVVLAVAEEGFDVMHLRLHAVVSWLLRQSRPLLDQEDRDRLYDLLGVNLHLYPLAGVARLLIDGRECGGDGNGLEVLRTMAAGSRLLVIDPLRQFHTGDENDSWVMTSNVHNLHSIACSHRCAVLLAHHTNKAATFNGQGDRAGAARGSAALTDNVRWQLNLSPLDETLGAAFDIRGDELARHIRADLPKANYMPPQPPQVLRREAGGVFELVTREPGRAVARKRGRS